MKYSPILTDKKAVNTGEGLDRVVADIEEVLNPPMTEDIHQQLHEAEETLQEYRCPYCGSPLSTRSSVPLSEHDEGTYEDFECGYAHIDGYMERPCPSDPKFPKLDDYEFIYKELQGDSYWKWQCFASGKTKEARKLTLAPGMGRTKEEAREKIEESYREHAKAWK